MESQLQAARRVYNSEVNVYNNAVMSFPSNLFAMLYGYRKENYFEAKEEEKENVEINLWVNTMRFMNRLRKNIMIN